MPEPQKASSTRSPGWLEAATTVRSRSRFFSVGYDGYGGSLNSQMSWRFFPRGAFSSA